MCATSYVENAISRLKDFDSNYGDEGKAELNAICSAHVLTLDVDEAKRFSYCGCDVTEDGKLRILFAPGYMGTNIYDALAPAVLLKALNDAPGSTGDGKPMSYAARTGIRLEWTEKIGETHKKLAEILGKSVDEVKIEPSFEATFEVLSKESKRKGNSLRDDWQSIIGDFTRRYYEGLAYQMEYQKFGEDELLREGFHESVSTGEIVFRIVDKLKYDSYGEVVVEDGRLYIQCKPDTFGTNVDYCAQKLVDQL